MVHIKKKNLKKCSYVFSSLAFFWIIIIIIIIFGGEKYSCFTMLC